MVRTPGILVLFANSREQYLEQLKEESRAIRQALDGLHSKGFIHLEVEENAESKDVISQITRWKDSLQILHFGGHADGLNLEFLDGKRHVQGLAEVLRICPKLQLVFLNGCATESQVRFLFKAGVPAVIATRVSVEDHRAVEFSQTFYAFLANRLSIQQAFDSTAGAMQMRYGPDFIKSGYRDLKSKTPPEAKFPWGLYVQSAESPARQFRLPIFKEVTLPSSFSQSIQKNFPANKFIFKVLERMCHYNPDIYQMMTERRGEEVFLKDSSRFPELIMENFSWPIGAQIRLLYQKKNPDEERLKILLSTYKITTLFLYYVFLSDVWDQHHRGVLKNKPSIDQVASKSQFEQNNYLGRLRELVAPLNNLDLYVHEIHDLVKKLKDEESNLFKAWQFLEELCANLYDKTTAFDWESACINGEKALAILLYEVAFLARFRLMTIRTVMLDYPRFANLEYDLNMGPLHASESNRLYLYHDEQYRRKKHHANSHSIMLAADENHIQHALNLSPFLMDANTFAQIKQSQNTREGSLDPGLAHIFMLGWEENDRLIYLKVDHDLFTALDNKKGTDQMHTQLRQQDFAEGTNLTGKDFDPGFDFGFEEESKMDSPLVFQLLYEQYKLFQAEMC